MTLFLKYANKLITIPLNDVKADISTSTAGSLCDAR